MPGLLTCEQAVDATEKYQKRSRLYRSYIVCLEYARFLFYPRPPIVRFTRRGRDALEGVRALPWCFPVSLK